MTCEYEYETRNRLTAIEYKDGATVLDGFYYEMDDTGNITKTTDELGGYWDYQYDDRYRLTDAILTHDAGVRWSEEYTYDDGDNMLTKKQPWSNLFNDGTMTDWTVGAGSWSVVDGALREAYSGAANHYVYKNQPEDDIYLWFSYKGNTSFTGTGLSAFVRRSSNGAYRVSVNFKTDGTAEIIEANGGAGSQKASCSTAYANGTWYDVCIKVDGTDIEVWKGLRGGELTQIMTYGSLAVTTSDTLMFQGGFYSTFDLDDMAVVKADGDPVETVTYAVNDANELSTMTDPNGTTTFGFDDWGRMTTKVRGVYEAEYGYRYGVFLQEYNSNFPYEDDVEYDYRGDGWRFYRNDGATEQYYRSDELMELVNEEDSGRTLTRTVVGSTLADISGNDADTGATRYYQADNLLSTRTARASNKSLVANHDHTPFGSSISSDGEFVSKRFAGTLYEPAMRSHVTPFRFMDPQSSRWNTQDPLGSVDGLNLYAYVRLNPISNTDVLGLACGTKKGWFKKTPPEAFANCQAKLDEILPVLYERMGGDSRTIAGPAEEIRCTFRASGTSNGSPAWYSGKKETIFFRIEICDHKYFHCAVANELYHLMARKDPRTLSDAQRKDEEIGSSVFMQAIYPDCDGRAIGQLLRDFQVKSKKS